MSQHIRTHKHTHMSDDDDSRLLYPSRSDISVISSNFVPFLCPSFGLFPLD